MQMLFAIYQDVSLCKECIVTHSNTDIVVTINGNRVHYAKITYEQLCKIYDFYKHFDYDFSSDIEEPIELLTKLGNLHQTEEECQAAFGKYLELYNTDTIYFEMCLEKEQNTVSYSASINAADDLTIPNAPTAFIKYIIDTYGTLDAPYYRTTEMIYYDADDKIIDDFFILDEYVRMEERQLSPEEIEVSKSMYRYAYCYRAHLDSEQILTEYGNWYRKVKIDELLAEL